MVSQTLWYCENINLYKILCPPKLKGYERLHYKTFKHGDFIYFEADTAQEVFMVSKGKVKIASYSEDGKELIKAILTKGELFGEMIILGEQKRKDFAVSLSKDTAVCPMNINKMYDLMRCNQQFSSRIYKLIGFRIRKLERRLEMILFKDASTRFKEFISDLALDKGVVKEDCIVIKHPYTQVDIARLIGLSREKVNHLFRQFKSKTILNHKRYQIEILCPKWKEELFLEG